MHAHMCGRVLTYLPIVEVDTGMASAHSENPHSLLHPFLGILSMYSVFQHPQQYYKGLVAEQMAVMIHHFGAMQKQQLLCRQFMGCGIMVCKMNLFSWKAASENNPYNLGENRSEKQGSLKRAMVAMFDHFTLHYCVINMYEYIYIYI